MAMTIIGNQETFRSFLWLASIIMGWFPRLEGEWSPGLIGLRDRSASPKAANAI